MNTVIRVTIARDSGHETTRGPTELALGLDSPTGAALCATARDSDTKSVSS